MTAGASEFALTLDGLTKSYGELKAVDNLSLEIHRGEIFGFLGPNGAGKTTTISMICGLLRCDAGEIRIAGKRLSEETRACRRLLGLCPQNIVIWEGLTCLEQLEMTGRLYDMPARAARVRAGELLEVFGLAEKSRRLAKTLSGGMKRRMNIALALVHEPQILILDEPQAGLDPQSRVLVREYIRSLAPSVTVILTTHEMDEADRLSDRVAVIDHGRILVLDTPQNLKSRIGEGDILEVKINERSEEKLAALQKGLPSSLRQLHADGDTLRLVGGDWTADLPFLAAMIKENGMRIEDITVRKKSLEDVFIALTGRRLRE